MKAAARVVAFALLALHCGKSPGPKAAAQPEGAVASAAIDEDAAASAMDDREREAWSEADGGEPAELLRLVDLVGCSGLQERAATPALRLPAVRAMRYCTDFSELPWLAGLASTGPDDLATEALDAIVEQAARRRRAVDPEDADELHEGCATLLGLARSADRPRPRRVVAIRALRMLAERGCVQKADIPTELDAK